MFDRVPFPFENTIPGLTVSRPFGEVKQEMGASRVAVLTGPAATVGAAVDAAPAVTQT